VSAPTKEKRAWKAGTTRKTRSRPEGGCQEGHYRPLPKQFRRDGFTFRQIAREGDAAIYEQTWSACPDPSVCYEVIRIRRREGFRIGGRFVEPAEGYPNSEAWGVDGFTVTDKEKPCQLHRKRESERHTRRFGVDTLNLQCAAEIGSAHRRRRKRARQKSRR
jgi:hypothetical protein